MKAFLRKFSLTALIAAISLSLVGAIPVQAAKSAGTAGPHGVCTSL